MVASPVPPTVWAAAGVAASRFVLMIPSAAAAPAAVTRREKFRKACSLRVATENHQRDIPLVKPPSQSPAAAADLGDANSAGTLTTRRCGVSRPLLAVQIRSGRPDSKTGGPCHRHSAPVVAGSAGLQRAANVMRR